MTHIIVEMNSPTSEKSIVFIFTSTELIDWDNSSWKKSKKVSNTVN